MANRNEVVLRTVYRMYRKDRPMSAKDSYIGSTGKKLKDRLSIHLAHAIHCNFSSKLYQRIRELGTEKWDVEELTSLICDRDLIFEFEDVWISVIKPGLNERRAVRDSPLTERTRKNCRKLANTRVTCPDCRIEHSQGGKVQHQLSKKHVLLSWLLERTEY